MTKTEDFSWYKIRCKLSYRLWHFNFLYILFCCIFIRTGIIKRKIVFSVLIHNVGMFASFNWILYLGILCERWMISDYVILFRDNIYGSGSTTEKDSWTSPLLVEKKNSFKKKELNLSVANLKSLPFIKDEITNLDLDRAHTLFFNKYGISSDVNSFVENYLFSELRGRYFAIHIRGTDKYKEAPVVRDEIVIEELAKLVEREKTSEFSLFLASDEREIIDRLNRQVIQNFPKARVFFLENFKRSVNSEPIHLSGKQHQYSKSILAFEALAECLILSKSQFLIKNASFFSAWSAVFNPKLPVIVLNEQYADKKWFPDSFLQSQSYKRRLTP